jgi:GNAT superfamily N-acetyltransferase
VDIRIRTAGIEDLNHILHHRRAMFEEIGFRDPAVLNRVDELSREYFAEALRTGAYRAWVAQNTNGRVLGGAGIVISSWPGYPGENHAKRVWILNMYTEPEARRQRIAKRLVQTIVDWCRKEGFSSVSLHASDAGRPLYASLGFQTTNEMRLGLK